MTTAMYKPAHAWKLSALLLICAGMSLHAQELTLLDGTMTELSHQATPQARTPTNQTGAISRRNPTPAARIAVSSFARCILVRVKSRETSRADGSTIARKLGMVTRK